MGWIGWRGVSAGMSVGWPKVNQEDAKGDAKQPQIKDGRRNPFPVFRSAPSLEALAEPIPYEIHPAPDAKGNGQTQRREGRKDEAAVGSGRAYQHVVKQYPKENQHIGQQQKKAKSLAY